MCEGISSISNGPIPAHPMFGGGSGSSEFSFNIGPVRNNDNETCQGPTKISGPIVNEFPGAAESKGPLDYSKVPKVHGPGKNNMSMGTKGDAINLLLQLQGRSIAPQSFKTKEPPKNHIATNQFKIKQQMRLVQERQAAKESQKSVTNVPVKALWKSEKYKNVPSKLRESINSQQPATPRQPGTPHHHQFLRAHSKTGFGSSRPQTARQAVTDNDDAKSLVSNRSKDDHDFIKQNRGFVQQVHLKRAPSVEQLRQVQQRLEEDMQKYKDRNLGKIPHYLQQRKEDARKELEEKRKNRPDPEQPPGHRKLPEEERTATLNKLKESHKQLLSQLNSMPIRNDTFRLRESKDAVNKKITELDEAIKIFSKPKVFVKITESST